MPKQLLSLYNFVAIFQPHKIWGFFCIYVYLFPNLSVENFKCYKDYILLQILHTKLVGWVIALTTLICPILRPVLHKIETAEKIKVPKLSKIKWYMDKLVLLFLVETEWLHNLVVWLNVKYNTFHHNTL